MKAHNMPWKERVAQWLPSRQALEAHPWLRRVAHHLREPALWRLHPQAVARGAAIGTFWAFVLPVAQMAAAVLHCIGWRAHIPTALALTLITNPLTMGPWLWLAYRLGALVQGVPTLPPAAAELALWDWLAHYGGPTLLGMGMLAVGGAALAYGGVLGVWRVRVGLRRARSRSPRRDARPRS